MTCFFSKTFILLLVLFLTKCLYIEAQKCNPNGIVKGKSPSGHFKHEDDLCCVPGKKYHTYKCSPPVSSHTKEYLTLNSFKKVEMVIALQHVTTSIILMIRMRWHFPLDGSILREGSLHNITISGNGQSVVAMVVDECDSSKGCDAEHDYQPPCANNIVNASMTVWKALGVPRNQWGGLDITWSDA